MNKFSNYNENQLEELFSNFLIDSWSYSKVTSFSRNEKEFEKNEIYRERSRKSSSSVAGNAYHSALELFFTNLEKGINTPIFDLEAEAFALIDSIPANLWKIQKTTPTVEECILKANKSSCELIHNFYDDIKLYIDELESVLGVEMRCEEWLVINGVDIPIPCHAVIDLVIRLKNGKVVIIDHKSKAKYTDEEELAFVFGKQAITYIKAFESKTSIKVDEVWFIENKSSKNKDGSPQLKKFVIELNKDTIMLYEVMLYEPLKRMIEAVSDPDYVYVMNDSDNFVDKAELYEFWAKTMIAEVDDFNVPENKKELITKRQKKIRDASISSINPKVISSFRENAASFITYDLNYSKMNNSEKIEHVLRTFSTVAKVAHAIEGFSSNTYLLEFSAGTKIASVMKYKLDIANALNVPSIRIGKDLMIYEDRSYLCVETPKKRTETLLWDKKYLEGFKIPIGIDNFGRNIIWDLQNNSTPHMLICGATGSGKSVCIKSTIEFAKLAKIETVILDPKREFSCYSKHSKVVSDIDDIEDTMRLLVSEMQERVISGVNTLKLIIFDEFSDAVSSSKSGKELDIVEQVSVGFYAPKKIKTLFGEQLSDPVEKFQNRVTGRNKSLEENLRIILQKGRSLGFRVVAATQRASVKVITGDAKVNFPVQVCFRVQKEIDSNVVLDESGAESLGGMGDGLIKSPEYLNTIRFQGFYKK